MRHWLGCLIGAFALGGCESLRTSTAPPEPSLATVPAAPPKRPGKHVARIGPFIVHSDQPIDTRDPAFKDLASLPEQIQTELDLPLNDTLVSVYLFENAEKYDDYMKARYPRLPKRRAYFFNEHRVGGGDDLLVITWPSEHLAKDLRHELTHATLHGTLKGVPLWLDEGLASFFELPPGTQGVNANHLDAIRRGPFLPDLARLEKMKQVHEMETPEYREAWAWTHLMLRGDPAARTALLDYLKELRVTANPGPLQGKLTALGDPNRLLADHMAKIDYPIQIGK